MIWTLAFWKGAAERAIKTFFQVFAALITADASGIGATVGLEHVSWLAILSVSGLAAVASLATSISNAEFTAGFDALAEARAEAAAEAAAKVVAAAEVAAYEASPQRALGFSYSD
jgi:hypothetical protein